MTQYKEQPAKPLLVTVCDRGFLPAACCQLVSAADYLPNPDAADLALICCDVSDEDKDNATRFFDAREVDARVIVADFADDIFTIATRWPRAAYLRLYFDRLFDGGVKRVVYMDADTRVRAPLMPLLTADLKGKPVGAVHDFIYYVTGHIFRRRRELMLSPDAPYLQSGVMVFDWQQTLAEDCLGRARAILRRYPDRCLEAPDQDALNHALQDRWKPLDPRWNLHEFYLMYGGRRRAFIEHYTSTKPWSHHRLPGWANAARWYKHQLADSPWPDFVEPQSFFETLNITQKFIRARINPRRKLKTHARFVLDALGIDHRGWDKGLPWQPRSRKDLNDMVDAMLLEAQGKGRPLRPPEGVLSPPMTDPSLPVVTVPMKAASRSAWHRSP